MARYVLITGSSHGIGAGCAVAFARDEGANIGITCNKNRAGHGGEDGRFDFKSFPFRGATGLQ